MKKRIIITSGIALGIVLILSILTVIFITTNKSDKFDLEKINWNLTMEELKKDVDEDFTAISNSYIHTYQGIKNVTDLETTVQYTFDNSNNLEKIEIILKTYEDSIIDKILGMSEEIESKESDVYKRYLLKLGESQIDLVGNVTNNAIAIGIEKYTEINQDEKNIFSINEIDWNATREELKEKTKIKTDYDNENEEYCPLGYTYDEIEGLTKNATPVIYYFSADGIIDSVFLPIDYSDETLEKALNYFNLSIDDGVSADNETIWNTQTSTAFVVIEYKPNDNIIHIGLSKIR